MYPAASTRGRPRSAAIDEAVLAAARRRLAEHGYAGLSFAAVAEEAGTTRPAIYRRWPTKAALAESAMASYPADEEARRGGRSVRRPRRRARRLPARRRLPGRLSLVGTMLQATTAPDAAERYRAARRRAAPRPAARDPRARRRLIDAGADLDVAVTMLTDPGTPAARQATPEPDEAAHASGGTGV